MLSYNAFVFSTDREFPEHVIINYIDVSAVR